MVGRCMVFVVRSLFVVCWLLLVVGSSLFAIAFHVFVCRLLFVVCVSLFVVRCWLLGVWFVIVVCCL